MGGDVRCLEMANSLRPRKGRRSLSPDEAVEKLRAEFTFVEADRDQASDYIGDMLTKFIELKAPQILIDAAVEARDSSYFVTLADDEYSDLYLQFLLRPDDYPFIGYESWQQEQDLKLSLSVRPRHSVTRSRSYERSRGAPN